MTSLILPFYLFIFIYVKEIFSTVSIVLWHGMGDSCCNPLSMGYIKKLIEMNLSPTPYVKSIQIGSSFIEDITSSYFMNVNKQIEIVCKQLSEDQNLSNGYNAIGFSQGGQFLRAVVQRCFDPPVFNLITIGAQHQGVFGYPHCPTKDHEFCEYLAKILNAAAYSEWVQKNLVQAEYWHDPINEDEYKHASLFLADINNELKINYLYRQHIMFLKNFVMVKFENDTMVNPPDSEWFGFFSPGQDKNITPLLDSALYSEDRLGLQFLNRNGRLHFLSVAGDHLQFGEEWFIKNIIQKFLSSDV